MMCAGINVSKVKRGFVLIEDGSEFRKTFDLYRVRFSTLSIRSDFNGNACTIIDE